jgi:hypothetical protein
MSLKIEFFGSSFFIEARYKSKMLLTKVRAKTRFLGTYFETVFLLFLLIGARDTKEKRPILKSDYNYVSFDTHIEIFFGNRECNFRQYY